MSAQVRSVQILTACPGVGSPANRKRFDVLRNLLARRTGWHVFYRVDDRHVRMLLDLAITHVGHSPARRTADAAGSDPSIHPNIRSPHERFTHRTDLS